jgi:hypothetical protein
MDRLDGAGGGSAALVGGEARHGEQRLHHQLIPSLCECEAIHLVCVASHYGIAPGCVKPMRNF